MSFCTRLGALLALSTAVLFHPNVSAQELKFKVIGQPLATGNIQKNKEQPFFENLAKNTGLPIVFEYKPIDTLGIKDTEQLRVMKSGLFEMVSLRVSQNSRDEPTLLGMDLVGASPDYATGRKISDAWLSTVDERLQKQFNMKLLGVWPFGPQMLFCKKTIGKIGDIKGMKVRVADQGVAKFIEMIGGTPVPMAFGEVHQALSLGVVDCAITGPSSANTAGWTEVTTHQLPLGFQLGYNGYGISLKAWNQLKPDQQATLKKAIDGLLDDIWTYSELLFNDALNCNAGKDPCTTGKKYNLVSVPVLPADVETVRGAVDKVSFPAWAEVCDKTNPGCSAAWKAKVGPLAGVK